VVLFFTSLHGERPERGSSLRRSFSAPAQARYSSLNASAESPTRVADCPTHSLALNSMLCFFCAVYLTPKGASTMEWVTPQHEEVDLNCEVSSYANAEL